MNVWLWIIAIAFNMLYGDMTVTEDRTLANGLDHVKIEESTTHKLITISRIEDDNEVLKMTFIEPKI